MKISDSKRDEIVNKLQQDIDAANAYYEKEIEPNVIERYSIYHAEKSYYKKMFPKLSKRCSIVSTDVQDTIESTMPALMKTFFGSTDVVTIQGADGSDNDDSRAQKMQQLINYQLEKNRFFMTFYQWAKDALITNLGIVKVDWDREYKQQQQQITLDAESYEQFAMQAQEQKWKIINISDNPNVGGFDVIYEAPVLSVNQPRVMNVLASEFRYSPDAIDLESADFIAHRKIVSLDYLRKQQENGMYDHVDDLTEKATTPVYTVLDKQNNEDIDDQPNTSDSGRRKVELYECYANINMSDDEDGELTPMIITVSNGVILRMEENTYQRNPFFVLSPRTDPHKIWPESGFVDLIAQLQHSKTAIIRQMIYNMAQGNDSKMAIDLSKLVDINDITENAQFIRVNGAVSEALQPIPTAPLQSWTFNMLEYLDTQKENRTGITKYNQGLDSNSLNKTATGINIITQQANQRLELIARIFAETGMYDMFRFLIKMNQLFINEETVIRLTNGPMQIDPSDLEGDFDLVVNAGMGAGAKQTNLQNLQMLQGIITQLASVGMAGPQQFYNVTKRTIEEIGYKNVDDFVISPDKMQPTQPKQPEASESVRAAITDAPWEVQAQFWQKQGFQVRPEWFTEKVVQDATQIAVDAHSKADAARGGGINGQLPTRQATTASSAGQASQNQPAIPQTAAVQYPQAGGDGIGATTGAGQGNALQGLSGGM
ncbi:hypothetical protein [Pectinatus frisingensis]|uniref:portal protein n=1 Tax=Pectinatus frisingensis TaxID=865 RepID=UPI0018C75E67|nr:hypothetical protein [Pectinatus frisingensis]